MPHRWAGLTLSTVELKRRLRQAVEADSFVIVQHALDRMAERGFITADVRRALRSGTHDPSKDAVVGGAWRYRIRGKTIDGRVIGLAVEVEGIVIVVTVIG